MDSDISGWHGEEVFILILIIVHTDVAVIGFRHGETRQFAAVAGRITYTYLISCDRLRRNFKRARPRDVLGDAVFDNVLVEFGIEPILFILFDGIGGSVTDERASI